jgi:hypothetical protein
MKKMKKKILKLAALALLAGTFSCESKEETKIPSIESGMYSETYPSQGHTKINVLDKETLEIIKGEYVDKFKYEILDLSIKITLMENSPLKEEGTELYFRIISDSKFEIGNLYASVPESPVVIMIFEK